MRWRIRYQLLLPLLLLLLGVVGLSVWMALAAAERARVQIEERVREAWIERMVVSVFVEPGDPHRPVLLILRRAPRR